MDRLQLQALLEATIESEAVYFQSPGNVDMEYPCVVYSRDRSDTTFADNRPYSQATRYQVTLIDRNPDSVLFSKIRDLPQCLHIRSFPANNLHHDVFTLVS